MERPAADPDLRQRQGVPVGHVLPDGLYLFARYPDTALAATNIARFVGAVRTIAQSVARTGNFTPAALHQVPSAV